MDLQTDMMAKLEFLLGDWHLEYRIPQSVLSAAATGSGTGTIKRALNNRYVCFDYAASFSTGNKARAHAIFAWDEKAQIYRYWWFEDSGNFLTATCNFVNDKTLFLNWHDTLLIQTFTEEEPGTMILQMSLPDAAGKYEPVLEVLFTRE